MGACRTTDRRTRPRTTPRPRSSRLCRDLIRIDTTNYGDEDGPGERKAAEHVATLLDEVGIESRLYESEPGRTSLVAHWGGTADGGDGRAAAARPPRRRARGRRGLAGGPVLRRDPGRLPVGPRRGRHEGLRRDAALGRPGAHPRRPRCRSGRSCSASPPTRRPAGHKGAEVHGRGAPRGARGLHRGGRRGRRLQRHRPRPADLPHRGRREGHGLDEADRPRPRRARLDDQPRERRHRARPRRSPGSAPTSGRCG